MQVYVVGAGAMGCLYGAAFAAGGCDVTLIDANAEHVAAINRDGLEVETRQGTARLPLAARLPDEAQGAGDLILLMTKTYHSEAALAGVKHLIGEQTHVLTLQNGLGNVERVSAAHVPRGRILVGVSTLPADLVGPGRIRSLGDGGSKLYPAFSPETEFAAEVCRVLTSGGLPAQLEPDILEAIWSKAVFNSAMNPLCALTRQTPGFFREKDESRALIAAMVEEGVAAARASGIMIEAAPIHALTDVSMTDHADHEASMLQDVKAGRRTEIDAISGAIVEAGRRKGVATPVTETMWRLVKLEEAKFAAA
jgi:2-dehydropantoate 2-reductase